MSENVIVKESIDAVNATILGYALFKCFNNSSNEIINPYNKELNNLETTTKEFSFKNEILSNNSIQDIELIRKNLVENYKTEILTIIKNDRFEDGMYSQSEAFIDEQYNKKTATYIKSALNELYIDFFRDTHVLTGIMLMAGCISYDSAFPELPTMAIGLLQHEDDEVRDCGIQAFERWNSKKGLIVLESLKCEKKWMRHYVDKVIEYIKREGVD
jgi:hypothetical protein